MAKVNGLTVTQVMDRLSLSRPTVIRLIEQGQLKAYRKTTTPRSPFIVDRASVDAFERRRMESIESMGSVGEAKD